MTKIGVGNSNISIREVSEKEVYSITESQEFIKALDRMPDELIYKKVPLKFLILTGVRISELQGLRWSDIDFEHKVLHINFGDSPRLAFPLFPYRAFLNQCVATLRAFHLALGRGFSTLKNNSLKC